jgi:hypothetical protein
MEEHKSILEAEFNGLKDLLNEKLSNLCKEMARNNSTLIEHNGRLRTMEKLVEQGKGAAGVVSGFWGLVGGAITAIIVYFLTKHL